MFFLSGLTKIHDWSVTLALFTDEYHVPVLPPAVAAVMGTATELSMPVLLALGLATRFGAFVLFFFNIIAVVSYAALPDIAIKDHMLWGTMILVILLCGPGKISIDHAARAAPGARRQVGPAAAGRSGSVTCRSGSGRYAGIEPAADSACTPRTNAGAGAA